MSKPKQSVEDKCTKQYPDFIVECQTLDVEGLNKKLLAYAKHSQEIKEALENDEKLNELKEQVKEFSGPYRDSQKAVQLKMRYIMSKIKEMGGT